MPSESPPPPAPWAPPAPLPLSYRTARLLARPFVHADAPAILDAVESSRDSLLPWMPWAATDNRSIPECHYTVERFARGHAEPLPAMVVLGFFDAATGTLAGGGGLHHFHPPSHAAEIGYWIRADRRRQGLCTEGVAGLLDLCFAPQAGGGWGLRRIEIRCAGGNIASAAVARRLGLREEARLRQHRWLHGRGWEDELAFGVLRDEWPPRAE